jgi:hypothetical protein
MSDTIKLLKALSLATRIAKLHPWVAQGPNDDESCFFCGAEKGDDHIKDCEWVLAQEISE